MGRLFYLVAALLRCASVVNDCLVKDNHSGTEKRRFGHSRLNSKLYHCRNS